MTTEREFSNEFKFALYQGDVLFCEKIFNADQFNPFTRYSIDIREILPRAITKLQKTLSKRSYQTQLTDDFDLFQYHHKIINQYPQQYRPDMKYNPEPIIQQIENKTIKGVECKIGLYINDKPIVERQFYVDGFNSVSRWSLDIIYVIDEIVEAIFQKIKKSDIKNMWDDYDLINVKGLTINQIRELSYYTREDMLRKIHSN